MFLQSPKVFATLRNISARNFLRTLFGTLANKGTDLGNCFFTQVLRSEDVTRAWKSSSRCSLTLLPHAVNAHDIIVCLSKQLEVVDIDINFFEDRTIYVSKCPRGDGVPWAENAFSSEERLVCIWSTIVTRGAAAMASGFRRRRFLFTTSEAKSFFKFVRFIVSWSVLRIGGTPVAKGFFEFVNENVV